MGGFRGKPEAGLPPMHSKSAKRDPTEVLARRTTSLQVTGAGVPRVNGVYHYDDEAQSFLKDNVEEEVSNLIFYDNHHGGWFLTDSREEGDFALYKSDDPFGTWTALDGKCGDSPRVKIVGSL